MYFDFSVASVPSHQIHEDAEEGTVSIVDKVTKVTKVIFGETLTGTLSSEDKSEAQNSVVEPDHVKNGALPCDTKAQEKMQELNLGDAGQVINHGQVLFNYACSDVFPYGSKALNSAS